MRQQGVKRRKCTIPQGNCRLASGAKYRENWGDFSGCQGGSWPFPRTLAARCTSREAGTRTTWELFQKIAQHASSGALIRDQLDCFSSPEIDCAAIIAADAGRAYGERGGDGGKRGRTVCFDSTRWRDGNDVAGAAAPLPAVRPGGYLSRLVLHERPLPRMRPAVRPGARISPRVDLFQLRRHGLAGRHCVLFSLLHGHAQRPAVARVADGVQSRVPALVFPVCARTMDRI